MFKEFFNDNEGLSMTEYLAGGAIVVALLATALWSIATSANDEGKNVGMYIGGIKVPTAP